MTSFKTTKVVDDLLRKLHAEKMNELLTDTTEPINGDIWYRDNDLEWITTTRIFVSDLPWYRRFLIWLFPRMYDIREYNP